MAKFKCKHSGNVYEFKLQHDIEAMRKHLDYEEVTEEVKPVETKKQTSKD